MDYQKVEAELRRQGKTQKDVVPCMASGGESAVSRLFNGTRNPKPGENEAIAKLLGKPLSYFAKDAQLYELASAEQSSFHSAPSIPDTTSIPYYEVSPSCGPGTIVPAIEKTGKTKEFETVWLMSKFGTSNPKNFGVMAVSGDSMGPIINHGDIVLVDLRQTIPTKGGVYVFQEGDELRAKRLFIDPIRKIIKAKGDNEPTAAELEYRIEEVRVIGQIVWRAGGVP